MRLIFLLLALFTSCSSSKEELHIFGWADMIDPKAIEEFEERFDCKVFIDTYDSNETMFAKLRSGAKGYDLVVPSQYYVDIMAKEGMLEKLHPDAIPNLRYLDENALRALDPAFLEYAVPLAISFTGLGWRSDKISDMDFSWLIYDRKALRRRMTLYNDIREVIGAALLVLGFDPNTQKEEEIEKAADIVIGWKRNIAKFENEQYKNGLATAEFLVVMGASTDILQVRRENPAIEFSYPKEGTFISYDMLAIPKMAPNPALAHAFIDFLYEPHISARNMERIYELIPNIEAYNDIDPSLLKEEAIFPPESVWKRLHVIRDLGEGIRLYQKAWNRIKDSK